MKETLQKALDALGPTPPDCCGCQAEWQIAITAVQRALAQPEPNYKKALEVWLDKTEWVQETVKPHELGMHRADVLKQRIEEALAQREQDGQCKYCTDGCPACDARKLPEQPPYHHFVSDRFNIDPQTGNLNIGAVKKQEPVAWRAKNFYENQEGWFYAEWHQDGLTPQVAELLYKTPPQRTWVGLTDEEIRLQWSEFWEAECHPWAIDFAQAIEAKLRNKNESKN